MSRLYKQISLNAMKKNGAPLLGSAKCILKVARALLPTRRGSMVIIVDASFGIQTNNRSNKQPNNFNSLLSRPLFVH